MIDETARVESLTLPAGRRILVISDIHGNLPWFEALLAQVGFSDRDELILDGDLLEKGPQSLALLHRAMRLGAAGNCHAVCGNCDDWYNIFRAGCTPEDDAYFLRYIRWRRSGLLWDMCRELGLDPMALTDFTAVKPLLLEAYPAEWAFLRTLPHALETERFVFAHAGVTRGKPLRAHTRQELNRVDAFLRHAERGERWVVVGHWPVVLYGEDRVCANPIIDRERRVVSIDGGCVLKDDGQLNALLIPDKDSDDFTFSAYDAFPERTVLRDQAEGGRSYYIRWGDNRVQVLERGAEFSRCRHIRTGYEMEVLTRYLESEETVTGVNDCSDYVLPLRSGDRVRVVEETGRGYYVKHRGVSGWYYGELA